MAPILLVRKLRAKEVSDLLKITDLLRARIQTNNKVIAVNVADCSFLWTGHDLIGGEDNKEKKKR